jgi:DNA-binding MurR/RpiR family transcriptional regulator
MKNPSNSMMKRLLEQQHRLTPKGQILGKYILENPRKAVFMTTKELSETCRVSEATVVRFVARLAYDSYGAFQQALRDHVDAEMTLLDRTDLTGIQGPGRNRLSRVVFEEMDNLKQFFESVDMNVLNQVVDQLEKSHSIYVVGSRVSYTYAYYLGWSLTKVRSNIRILKGSDSAAIDWLSIAAPRSLVIVIATSRYPNELIKLGKLTRRLEHTLLVITDSPLCPLNPFAHLMLVAPSKHIPLIGSPTTISCIINYLILELASRDGGRLKTHQEKLEQAYRENDILFNLD